MLVFTLALPALDKNLVQVIPAPFPWETEFEPEILFKSLETVSREAGHNVSCLVVNSQLNNRKKLYKK